jgi:hypothetical protein
VVGLADSKFSSTIFSKSEPAGPRGWPCRLTFYIYKKVSLQGHGVGPGGSPFFCLFFLKKIFLKKKHEKSEPPGPP